MNEIRVWTTGEMTIISETLSTKRKTCPVPLSPPHITYQLAWHQNPEIYSKEANNQPYAQWYGLFSFWMWTIEHWCKDLRETMQSKILISI